jgi:hypothetical protein
MAAAARAKRRAPPLQRKPGRDAREVAFGDLFSRLRNSCQQQPKNVFAQAVSKGARDVRGRSFWPRKKKPALLCHRIYSYARRGGIARVEGAAR